MVSFLLEIFGIVMSYFYSWATLAFSRRSIFVAIISINEVRTEIVNLLADALAPIYILRNSWKDGRLPVVYKTNSRPEGEVKYI